MLEITNAIKKEAKSRKEGGVRYTYIFNCSYLGCCNTVRARADALQDHSGLCIMHARRKRPFESIYASMFNDYRCLVNTLSYEEFLSFTDIKSCHYCTSSIKWEPYGTVNNEFKSRAYYLDRKDCALGYSKDNCVVCCTKCNRARGNRYSYHEWFTMTEPYRLGKL